MRAKHKVVLLIAIALSPLMCVTGANAQDQRQDQRKQPETTGSASGLPSGVPPAPVGHRQPRASELPSDIKQTPEEQTQIQRDRELDQQLWICRGCGGP